MMTPTEDRTEEIMPAAPQSARQPVHLATAARAGAGILRADGP
jgi:hypothetical protein